MALPKTPFPKLFSLILILFLSSLSSSSSSSSHSYADLTPDNFRVVHLGLAPGLAFAAALRRATPRIAPMFWNLTRRRSCLCPSATSVTAAAARRYLRSRTYGLRLLRSAAENVGYGSGNGAGGSSYTGGGIRGRFGRTLILDEMVQNCTILIKIGPISHSILHYLGEIYIIFFLVFPPIYTIFFLPLLPHFSSSSLKPYEEGRMRALVAATAKRGTAEWRRWDVAAATTRVAVAARVAAVASCGIRAPGGGSGGGDGAQHGGTEKVGYGSGNDAGGGSDTCRGIWGRSERGGVGRIGGERRGGGAGSRGRRT